MDEEEAAVTCTDCGAPRLPDPGPCPECGSGNRTVHPDPVQVETSVPSLRTVDYLQETRPGWSVIKKVSRLGSAAVGFVLPVDPEIAGTVDMAGEVGALYAEVEGARFVILISP